MKERKRNWIIDLVTILVMMATVILLCHPIGRDWTEEEIERYVGTDGVYSPDVDTYYYLRKAKEFSRGGIGSITLVANRAEDPMCTTGDAIAKEANGAMPMLLPASAALTWYGLRAVGIDVSIYDVTIRFCSFLLSLFVIPVYLFLRKRTSWIAAVLGALLVALDVPFFRHSHVGFFDTDAMIGLLALILVLSLYECFVRKTRKEQAIFGVIAFVTLVLLRFTWTAFFIYGVIAVGTSMIGVIGIRLCGEYKDKQKKAFVIPFIVCASIVVASLFFGWNSFVSLAKGFVSSPAGAGDWPSETYNIEELQRIPLSDADSFWYHFVGLGRDLTSVTGGAIALLLLVVSVGICAYELIGLIRHKSKEDEKVFILSVLLTWLLGTAFLAVFGIRYMEFLTLPSALVIGLGFDHIVKFCKQKNANERRILYVISAVLLFCGLTLRFPIAAVVLATGVIVMGWFLANRKGASVLAGALALSVILPVCISCMVVCAEEAPLVESPIENAMLWVKDNTSRDAVLADYWNLGYIYQYFGERRTIADGGTYNGQFFYWLANMVVTDDVRLSVGIARMLQYCGIDGSEYAQELLGDADESRNLLKSILPLTRTSAEAKLTNDYEFSKEQIEKLLDYTHPLDCADIYFVASHNTFELVSSLMTYRNWANGNGKAEEGTYYSVKEVSSPKEGETVYSRLTYGVMAAIELRDNELLGKIVTNSGDLLECGRMIYIKDGEMVFDRRKTEYTDGQDLASGLALMLFEENGKISSVLLDKEAADAVSIRLFLMDGENQSVFEKVYDSEEKKDNPSIQGRMDDASSVSIWRVRFD